MLDTFVIIVFLALAYVLLFAKERMSVQLSPGKFSTESKNKNAAAIAWIEQWYSTPDNQLPSYWEEFEALLKTHPIDFGTEDFDL